MRYISLLFLLFIPSVFLLGQSLDNPSFEGEPQDAVVPMGWHWCEEGTTPDIAPGPWGVYTRPSDGDTYVGLITRTDGTFESIGQRFDRPLKENSCYTLKLDLAHSPTYTGYNVPTNCRIWLGKTKCDRDFLVAEIKNIANPQWKTHNFKIEPEKEYEYIIIEAYYPNPGIRSAGNILVDNIRPLSRCDGV